jgi:Mn-dependent DtxR family transcriptional regulator
MLAEVLPAGKVAEIRKLQAAGRIDMDSYGGVRLYTG